MQQIKQYYQICAIKRADERAFPPFAQPSKKKIVFNLRETELHYLEEFDIYVSADHRALNMRELLYRRAQERREQKRQWFGPKGADRGNKPPFKGRPYGRRGPLGPSVVRPSGEPLGPSEVRPKGEPLGSKKGSDEDAASESRGEFENDLDYVGGLEDLEVAQDRAGGMIDENDIDPITVQCFPELLDQREGGCAVGRVEMMGIWQA